MEINVGWEYVPRSIWFSAVEPVVWEGRNTGVGCHFLLQGIFWTQGLNRGLLHCRQVLYH